MSEKKDYITATLTSVSEPRETTGGTGLVTIHIEMQILLKRELAEEVVSGLASAFEVNDPIALTRLDGFLGCERAWREDVGESGE